MDCSISGFPVRHQLLELAQTHIHWVSDTIQPSYPLSSPSSPAFSLSSFRVFSNESVLCIRWPKYWNFSFSISSSNEYSGLISFRIDWFDLLAVQGTLKSLLEHHSSKPSIPQRSAFFKVQLSHPYMTTGKTIALTSQTFVSKVMSLPLKMLSKMEKEMATHSSTLAWEIPCTEEPGRLQSMGSQRVRHDWGTTHSSWSQLFFQGANVF